MIFKGKTTLIILCLALLVTLAACGKDTASNLSDSTPPPPSISSDMSAENEKNENQDASDEAVWGIKINTVTLDDVPVTEEMFKDNDLTVLNIWGTWCPPCVSELPHLQEVSERFKDKNVQIVGVLQDGIIALGVTDSDVIESAKTLLSEAGAAYTVILPDKTIMTQFIEKMQYFPTTFFINSKGEVVHTAVGANDADSWEEIINEVLEEISK